MQASKIEERHRWFLTECLKADGVKHSGRSLYDHLVGTHDILASWGASEAVRLAGLFHSVYGTNAFKHACLRADQLMDRRLVVGLIGEGAEFLAHVFCVADRPRVFLQAWELGEPVVLDRVTGEAIVLLREELADLLEIEAANLLEQGAKAQVLWLMARCSGVTGAARRALLKRLGAQPEDPDVMRSAMTPAK